MHFTIKKELVIVISADFSKERFCTEALVSAQYAIMMVLWCKSKKYSRQKKTHQRQQAFSPTSPDSSTLTDLQPSWPLRSILVAAPLPPLLEPPVSRIWPGLTKQVAIPSPCTQTGVVRTLRAVGLNKMDGTADTEPKHTNELQHSLFSVQGMGPSLDKTPPFRKLCFFHSCFCLYSTFYTKI